MTATRTSAQQPVTDPRRAENQRVADLLREAADLLVAQGANPFRVSAYRKAADTLVGLPESVGALFERDGREGLEALPGIGRGLSAAIAEIVITGRWTQLERLRGEVDAAHLFRSIPGVGPELAERIHDTLDVDSLEGLEAAALEGRLEGVPGVGPRRAAAIRAALAQMLDRRRSPRTAAAGTGASVEPDVALLLDLDHEYRDQARLGRLPTIAPRRFNPAGEAWLPVLHARRGDWHFTALFSNTARAHELGRTRDWVVVYFYDGDHSERQRTIVTETCGPLAGQRVVRGREADCRTHYARATAGAS